MRDFVSQITNLKAEFQRIADRVPWVRARFTLKDGKFDLFVLGSPVEDAAIVSGVRSGSDLAMVTELYALTDEANVLVAELVQSRRYDAKTSSPTTINFDLSTPVGFWLMFLVRTFHTTVNCWATGPSGKTPWIGTLQSYKSNIDFPGWIDNYPQLCVSALTWLKKGITADASTLQPLSAPALAAGPVPVPENEHPLVPSADNETSKSSTWTKTGPFGLTLDTNTHTVERNGHSVEFDASGRPWEVFIKLVERYPGRYLVRDLGHDVWNPEGNEEDPSDNLVQQAITALRKIIDPLGFAVKHSRNLGFSRSPGGELGSLVGTPASSLGLIRAPKAARMSIVMWARCRHA